ncbi:uncharacterized protein LOC142563219 [Dermacentor variabilis]|uniref:uncharacterized protein LOC142563219 n=1 Tax=Dermacentor variabilis TaxID=34621 RepID=UPI003F5CBC42
MEARRPSFGSHKDLKNDNLSAYRSGSLDLNTTLGNVIQYGKQLIKSNDTVFYHFTWSTDGSNEVASWSSVSDNVARFATNGTFCTQNTSAAVIQHKYGSGVYWATVKATTTMFGSEHFIAINKKDRNKMNETFSKCPKREETGNIPAC